MLKVAELCTLFRYTQADFLVRLKANTSLLVTLTPQ